MRNLQRRAEEFDAELHEFRQTDGSSNEESGEGHIAVPRLCRLQKYVAPG